MLNKCFVQYNFSFEGSSDKIDRVTKAVNQISHTHYGKPAYESNVRLAYDILSQCKGKLQCS